MAPRGCTVCAHSQREQIDAEMVLQLNDSAIGREYGLSRDSVRRHRRNHLSPAVKAIATRRQTKGARKAVDRIYAYLERAEAVLDSEAEAGNTKRVLEALREARGQVELLAKLTGELDERPQIATVVNVATSPEWLTIRSVLADALRPYPEAARAVSLRLSGIKELTP